MSSVIASACLLKYSRGFVHSTSRQVALVLRKSHLIHCSIHESKTAQVGTNRKHESNIRPLPRKSTSPPDIEQEITNHFFRQIILFVTFGSVTYGYSSSIIATTLGQPTFRAYFELDTRPDANALIGAMNGLYQAGGLIGVLSAVSGPLTSTAAAWPSSSTPSSPSSAERYKQGA